METSHRPRGGCIGAKEGEYITEAVFRIPDGLYYIRLDLCDEHGNWAHTRAYNPDGSKSLPNTPFFDDKFFK